MENLVGDTTGLIHLLSSIAALIFGTAVLMLKKGTRLHVNVGYAYVMSMSLLLITAFLIYRLFGGWGLFHYFSILSAITLAGGMIPILIKLPKSSWASFHFSFMYWSVIGLYCAFAAEVLTRIPHTPFFSMVGVATGAVAFTGAFFFRRKKSKWNAMFNNINK